MTTRELAARPEVVSREQWLTQRIALLTREKELTRLRDQLNAQRRRLPMVRIEKPYTFTGPEGTKSLRDLFDSRRQLIVYHFMFDPADKEGEPFSEGCSGCSHVADNFPHLAHLHARDTSLVMISRAPWHKIAPFKERMGWDIPWYSSHASDFNYDFHATLDESRAPIFYNYKTKSQLLTDHEPYFTSGEGHALSTFLRDADEVFHTYSTFARGVDHLLNVYNLLDLTALGRQEDWEDSPHGWPQSIGGPAWLRHHDRYNQPSQHARDSCGCNP